MCLYQGWGVRQWCASLAVSQAHTCDTDRTLRHVTWPAVPLVCGTSPPPFFLMPGRWWTSFFVCFNSWLPVTWWYWFLLFIYLFYLLFYLFNLCICIIYNYVVVYIIPLLTVRQFFRTFSCFVWCALIRWFDSHLTRRDYLYTVACAALAFWIQHGHKLYGVF